MIKDKKKIGIIDYSEKIKEVSIRKNFPEKQKREIPEEINFLYCDPPEIILQNVEKNKMYEIPVRIYNISSTSKRISIRPPEHGYFKVDYDRKKKYSQIVPGWYLEILVSFESDQVQDDRDCIIISSENGFRLTLNLRANRPIPIVNFEPLINFGFVPVNSRKTETIEFMNDGMVDTKIELRLQEKNTELTLEPAEPFVLMKSTKENKETRKKKVRIIYEPKETSNLHEKIEVIQIAGDEIKPKGFIEVIATSVFQQLSVVFEEGGGPQTEINFGLLYYGQSKECAAFLVNNGPKEIGYKFNFFPDKKIEPRNQLDYNNFESTPEQVGKEMTQRILSADPDTGQIRPYTQVPIRFICKTKIPDKGWRGKVTQGYGYKENQSHRSDFNPAKPFKSTATINFEDVNEKLSLKDSDEKICPPNFVYMEVKAIFPDITLDKTMLNFWECKLHEKKIIIIKITNENEELPVDFSFNKIPHFTVKPSSGIIHPGRRPMSIKVKFHPENYGNFSDVLVLRYINNLYEVPIRVMGICREKGKKLLDEDSEEELKNNLVPDEKAGDFTKPKKVILEKGADLKRIYEKNMEKIIKEKSNEEIIKNFGKKFEDYEEMHEMKLKANMNIRLRQDKLTKQNPKVIAMQHFQISNERADNKNPDGLTLLDVLMLDRDNVLDSPRLKLPEPNEDLWVLKPIGKYEPIQLEETVEYKKINLDANILPKEKDYEKYNRYPKTHRENKDCEMDLDGYDLQKIQIGNNGEIDFGEVFIKSEMTKTFWIKNNLRTHIFVQLEFEYIELDKTTEKAMVIPPGATQGFNITLYSKEEKKKVVFPVKYIINNKHKFVLRLSASFVLARLEQTSAPLTLFTFRPEKGEKNQVEMSVRQKLVLRNPGNAPASLTWKTNRQDCFKVNPQSAVINPKQEFSFEFTFSPMELTITNNKEIEGNFKAEIENGVGLVIPVVGKVSPCTVRPEKNIDVINFGDVAIGVPQQNSFVLVNDNPRIVTAYMIKNPRPDVLFFEEPQGYIEKTRAIKCSIESKEEKELNLDFDILIRGGPKIPLKVKAKVIRPDISIEQEEFIFGNVEINESVIKSLTFKNTSKIPAQVYINLDSNIYLRDFKMELSAKNMKEKEHLIKSANRDKLEDNISKSDSGSDEDGDHDSMYHEAESNKSETREFTVTIPAVHGNEESSKVEFDLIFCPTNLTTSKYDFITNFSLAGVEECKGLQRKITANIIKSAITPSRSIIEFKKTFIYEKDPRQEFEEIRLSNCLDKKVKWEFITEPLDTEGIFCVKDRFGILSENIDAAICTVRFTFCPQARKKYESKVVLITKILDRFGQEEPDSESRKTFTLKGEGTLPRLFFDKRELILPIVPLGFDSSIEFRVKHEGYDNTKVRNELRCELGQIQYKVECLDEDNIIGYMKNELKMKFSFKSNKPLSFTAKLVFFDDDDQEFIILVAGTTDNSLFTNYHFYQRNYGIVEFVQEGEGAINLRLKKGEEENEEDKKSEKNSNSFVGSVITKSSIGNNKIRTHILEQYCKSIRNYLVSVINPNWSIENFPEDVIAGNGKILFELVACFTGTVPQGRVDKFDEDDPGRKAELLWQQYYLILTTLQSQGAYLNTVFPEYLLSFDSYTRYLSRNESRLKIMDSNWEKNHKSIHRQWQHINKESWITLIFQILKIYYLNRVNAKTYLQAISHLQNEQDKSVYEKYKELKIFPSNVYSNQELILLRWLQANYEYVNKNVTKYIHNFQDLGDGVFLSSLIWAYFPKIEEIKKKTKSQSDVKTLSNSVILDVLTNYGINTHFKNKKELLDFPQARDMVLFLLILFQNLQHFVVRETIEFSCILGDSVIKAIELKNPLISREIEYEVKTSAYSDFIFPTQNEIKIEPGKECEYPITFKSRISERVESFIYFVNKQNGWSKQAAPLVYRLVSNVTGRRSIYIAPLVSSPLYTKKEFKLKVKSPFKEKVEFEMTLKQQKKVRGEKKTNRGKMIKPLEKEKKGDEILYRVFFPKFEDAEGKSPCKLEYDTEKEIPFYFHPIDMDEYECFVIFCNKLVGEFQITINGKAELPLPGVTERWTETCYIEEQKEFNLEVRMKNKYLEEAENSIKKLDLPRNSNKKVAKDSLVAPLNSLLTNSNGTQSEKMTFSIETKNPAFIIINPLITPGLEAVSNTAKLTGDHFNTSNQLNTSGNKSELFNIKVKFSSKTCQIYEGDIIIRNVDKANDIRVYRLIVDVKPKNIFAQFEFLCPVKQIITQKIPIYNSTDKDWIIRADLSGNHHGFFIHESEKKIPRKLQTDYILKFAPQEKMDVSAHLILNNTHTKEIYNYTLIGKVDDPLAEEIIEIVCNAKEEKRTQVKLDNYTDKSITYTVETDLPDIVSGAPVITVPPGVKQDYDIIIKPILGKTYFGKITFTDEKKNYKWWTIKVDAKPTYQTQNITMKTYIRKVLCIDIGIDNPTNDWVLFHVIYEGEALFGANELRVEPNRSGIYTLNFSPLKVGSWEGELKIYNDFVGEFLYRIKLICDDHPPFRPPVLIAELGKSALLPIHLENPVNEEIDINYIISNKKIFTVDPEKIILPPFTTKEIYVRYTPSALELEEECSIKFESQKIGKWLYYIRGKANPPTVMDTVTVSTYVDGMTSGNIVFRNPLNEKVTVSIEMKCEEYPDTFYLLSPRDKWNVDAFKTLEIPFGFSPKKLTKYYANIFVIISKTLFWRYPIEGVTEVKSKGITHIFKTKAKKRLDQKITLDISNLPENDINREDFSFLMKFRDEKYQTLVPKCLTVEIDKTVNKDKNSNKLTLNIGFYPLRPFKTDCEFVLSKNSGGQWIYNMLLEATEPDPDDTIHIQSSLGKVAHVSFKLQNVFTKNARFLAYFSHDSTSEFSVSPREGVLDQSGREGTTFLVSYLPVEYGKVKIGKLIIETDDIQWIFEVKGTHLDYKPPEVKKSNIYKMTQATITRLGMNEKDVSMKRKIQEIKEERTKIKAKNRSRSRSKSP